MTHHLFLILRFVNLVQYSEETLYNVYKTRPIPEKYSFLYETEFYPLYFNRIDKYKFITFTINGKLYISIGGKSPDTKILRNSLISKAGMGLDKHNSCTVHEIPYNYLKLAFDDIKSQLDSFFNLYPEGEVEFCGYSAGGAVANIATARFQYVYPFNNFHCTTFGSFKPGGISLMKQLNSFPGRIQNFVLKGDKISSLPPKDQGYIMPKMVIISRGRFLDSITRERKYSFVDYICSMKKCSFLV